MTITGGTAIPREEIDRMVKEAESTAESDRKRREEAEARNQADNAIYAVEKALTDAGDKVPDAERAKINGKIEAAKEALKGTDVEAIKKATEELLQASHKLAEASYGQSPTTAEGGSGGSGEAASPRDDDVVEGEVVDEGEGA